MKNINQTLHKESNKKKESIHIGVRLLWHSRIEQLKLIKCLWVICKLVPPVNKEWDLDNKKLYYTNTPHKKRI
jgi:hypothetical protein